MGSMIPEICVCKERDGKTLNKKRVIESFLDENIRVLDYIGVMESAKNTTELVSSLEKYIPYEIFCIGNDEGFQKNSIVKIKCINVISNYGISIKISHMDSGKFTIYLLPIWEDEERGLLEYKFHNKDVKNRMALIEKSDKIFEDLLSWLKTLPNKSDLDSQDGENVGKVVYSYMKKLIDNN